MRIIKLFLAISLIFCQTAIAKDSYYSNPGTLLEGFNTTSDWTASGTGASAASNTVNVREGSQSITLLSTGGNAAYMTKTINLDMSGFTNFTVWMRPSDWAELSSVEIHFSSTTDFSKYYWISFSAGHLQKGEWSYLTNVKANFGNTNSESWANTMIRMRIKYIPKTVADSSVSIDGMMYNLTGTPIFIITHDDGYDSDFTYVYPKLMSVGFKATSFVNSSKVGTSGRLTLQQMKTMYDNGFDISNHTTDHQTLTDVDYAGQLSRISGCYDYLIANGFYRSAKFFAFPAGAYDANTLTISPMYSVLARRANGSFMPHFNFGEIDELEYAYPSVTATSSSTVTTMKGHVTNLITSGGVFVWYMHALVESDPTTYQWTVSAYNEFIDYLKTKVDDGSLRVMSFGEFYDAINNQVSISGLSIDGVKVN